MIMDFGEIYQKTAKMFYGTGISKYGTFDRLYKGILDVIRVKKIIKNNKTK